MAKIPDQTLQEILGRTSVSQVMERYLRLKRQGRRMVGLCPFHSEKTPSFSVDPEQGLWYCFGCQEGGNVFTFLQKIEGLSFVHAVQKLGQEVGIEVQLSEGAEEEDRERRRTLELLERCAIYYHELLRRSPLAQPVREYLGGRGVQDETAARFRLGWAPESGSALLKQLQRAGYQPQEGVEVGVLRHKAGRYRDTLRGRLVFPISDAQGRVIAFGGRALGDGHPKYLNTPETSLYAKRQHLYGLHQHRGPISRTEKALVVEGYMDVIMLSQVGVELAVASLGTALTEAQAKLLSRYARDVVLAYDADSAGQAATVKGIDIFETTGLRVAVAPLPAGEDPDSLARHGGAEAVETCLAQAQSVVDFYIERCRARFDLKTPEGIEDFTREVLPAIQRIRDSVKRDAYLVRVAGILRVSESKLAWRLKSHRVQARSRPSRRGLPEAEEMLLRVCVAQPQWISRVKESLEPAAVSREDLRPLYEAVFALEGRDRPLGMQDILPFVEDESIIGRWAAILLEEPPPTSEEDVDKLLDQAIESRQLERRKRELEAEVTAALNAGTLDPKDERFQEYQRLQRQLKKVSRAAKKVSNE